MTKMKNFTEFVFVEIIESISNEIKTLLKLKEVEPVDLIINKGIQYITDNDLLNKEEDDFFENIENYPSQFLEELDLDYDFTEYTTVTNDENLESIKQKELVLRHHATAIFVVLYKIYQTISELSEDDEKVEQVEN